MDLALVGAHGYLGTLVGGALDARDRTFASVPAPRPADDIAAGHRAVIAALRPGRDLDQLRAAVADAGGVFLDAVIGPPEPPIATQLDRRARERGGLLVLGAGWRSGVGDLLAARAAAALGQPTELYVTYHVPGVWSVLRHPAPGERAEVVRSLVEPVVAYEHGQMTTVRTAELRRLAWFPRPVGPHHAVVAAGGEPVMLPRHLRGLRTVRSQLAIRSWLAELLQGVGNAARTDAVRRRVERSGRRDRAAPSASQRQAERWAVVAEAGDDRGRVARAWAYGHDRHGVAAALVAVLVDRALACRAAGGTGLLAPAQVADSGDVLDDLAVRTDLRWAVSRPE